MCNTPPSAFRGYVGSPVGLVISSLIYASNGRSEFSLSTHIIDSLRGKDNFN